MSNTVTIIVSILSSSLLATIISLVFQVRFEKQKAELERESKRREILLSKLREQQAEVIEKYYAKLATLHMMAANVTSANGTPKDNIAQYRKPFWESANDFRIYSKTHRIFLTEEICDLAEKFEFKLGVAISTLETSQTLIQNGPKEKRDDLIDARNMVEEDAKNLKTEIEILFRKLMHVDELTSAS